MFCQNTVLQAKSYQILPVYTAETQHLESESWDFSSLNIWKNLILSTVQLQYVTAKDKKPQSLFH